MTQPAQGTLFAHTFDGAPSAGAMRAAAVLLAAALTALAAQFTVTLPFTAVPFTLQPTVVLLTALALGPRLGAAAQVTYLLAGLAGLPVWANSPLLAPGAARLLGPTAGYLWAYPAAAYLTGWLAARGWDRRYATSVLAMTVGLLVIFLSGVSWLTVVIGQAPAAALAAGFVPFFFLDLAKVGLAGMILPQAWRLLGRR
ncbi:MAG: biotin transporter BioY [Vicinamibacterales bacterium]